MIKTVSKKQASKNRVLNSIKNRLPKVCCICGKACDTGDLIHFLPKSCYPEYYTDERNLGLAHRECHRKYDDDLEFRQKQVHIYKQIASFDQRAADKYFRL